MENEIVETPIKKCVQNQAQLTKAGNIIYILVFDAFAYCQW